MHIIIGVTFLNVVFCISSNINTIFQRSSNQTVIPLYDFILCFRFGSWRKASNYTYFSVFESFYIYFWFI